MRFRVQLERIVHIQVTAMRTIVRCALKGRTVLVAQQQYQVLVPLATTVLQDLSLPHHNRAQQVLIEHLLLLPLKLHVLHALRVTIALSEAWVHLCCALQATSAARAGHILKPAHLVLSARLLAFKALSSAHHVLGGIFVRV